MSPATPDPAWQISTLADGARQLAERGEKTEAERIYRTILKTAPYHVGALMFLAARAMEHGKLDESQQLLEQALRADRRRPMVYQNLGLVYKARGDLQQALAAINQALALQPDSYPFLLHKGSILQDLELQEQALACYQHALRCLPAAPKAMIDNLALHENIRTLIRGALEFVRRSQIVLVNKYVDPVTAHYGKQALERVHSAAKIHLQITEPHYQHFLQRPAYLYIPDVTPQAFFERDEFDWISSFEGATSQIRTELETILANNNNLTPYVKIDENMDPQQWRGLNGSSQWSAYHLLKGGTIVRDHGTYCPHTLDAISRLPLPKIAGHAPEAFFSILRPGTHIPPHHGVGNYKLAAHLPLIVPDNCVIRVGHESRSWTEGQCLIFDDSFQHEAWNHSTSLRAVLIVEIWNPLLSKAEQEGVAALIAAITELNQGNMNGHGAT